VFLKNNENGIQDSESNKIRKIIHNLPMPGNLIFGWNDDRVHDSRFTVQSSKLFVKDSV